MGTIINHDAADIAERAKAGDGRARGVAPCNFRTVGQINRDEINALTRLHETFARNLAHSLGAYLRVGLELTLGAIEQLTYSEFLKRIPEITYLASLRLMPLDAVAAAQLDLEIGFPIIDLLLGGKGATGFAVREITDIEDGILENVLRVVARELQIAWQPIFEQQMEFDQRWGAAQILQFMPHNERVLVLSFELRLGETKGSFKLLLPAVAANALLRRLSQESVRQKRRGAPEEEARIRARLLQCPFALELQLPDSRISLRDLTELRAGQVISLDLPLDSPAFLTVGGLRLFAAAPARCGGMRAGQIRMRLHVAEKGKSHDDEL